MSGNKVRLLNKLKECLSQPDQGWRETRPTCRNAGLDIARKRVLPTLPVSLSTSIFSLSKLKARMLSKESPREW